MGVDPVDVYTLVVYRPDAIRVWEDDEVRKRLSWYLRVMRDEAPAKFRIARRVEAPENPYEVEDLESLWGIHSKLSREFAYALKRIRSGEMRLSELPEPRYSFLDVKIAIARRLVSPCRICERRCGARRLEGAIGACRVSGQAIVHTYFLHMGEESVLVPSGTIFYGGCNFRCVYCQNWDISQANPLSGLRVDAQALARIQDDLRRAGARNINHVGGDPTPHLHVILESLKYVSVNVPQLWNSNMYLTPEALELLKHVIDIWLPDFKYGNNSCGLRLSAAPRYFDVVTRNLKEIHDAGEEIIIRHLVLPNHIDCCTRRVLEYISRSLPRSLVNIMDQYRPEYLVPRMPKRFSDIARRPSYSEIREAFNIAKELGITKCVEDLCFIPGVS